MRKYGFGLVFLLWISQLNAGGFKECPDLISNDIPENKGTNTASLCRKAYLVDYDLKNKIPVYVAYDLEPMHAVGCEKRSNKFKEDPDIQSAFPGDYANSGYDKGHMAPAADFQWDKSVERESFYMSNISPQLPQLNRHSWERLEVSTRAWALSKKETLTVYTGTIYNDKDDVLNKGIRIPHAFFKIIVFNRSKFLLAFIYPQADESDTDIGNYQVSVKDIEEKTNLVFNFPYDKSHKSNIPDVDINIVQSTERQTCRR